MLTAKVSWKPLACPDEVVTCTLVSASITACGTGDGQSLPIISVEREAAQPSGTPGTPSGSVIRSRRPTGVGRAPPGRIARLASAIRQNCSGSPR